MKVITKRTHPRKPDWILCECDHCHDTFWIPKLGQSGSCAGCLTSFREDGRVKRGSGEATDIRYHGGQFNKGEW